MNTKFYKKFFTLYIIFVLQNVVTLGVNLTDNIMLGAYNETALSGAAAVNQIQFIFQQVLNSMGEGVVMFSSQYWGKGLRGPIKKIASTGLKTGLLFACILFVLVSLFPYRIISLFTTEQSIGLEGVRYLGIVRFTYLLFAVTVLLLAMLRSMEIVKIGFQLSLMTLLVNGGINYVLIYGKFGFPALGIQGAAIGTLIARILECSILILYIVRQRKRLEISLIDFMAFDRKLAGDYYKKTLPMMLVALMWGVSTALQTVILGHMTAIAIAANSVASVLFLLVKGGATGAASAASIVIGKAIGIGDMKVVKRDAKQLQKAFLAIAIVGGVFLFFLRIPFLRLYSLSPETKKMANSFLIVLSVVFMGMGYQMPTSEGIIRGGGSSEFTVKMNIISSWIIVLPLSFILAFVVKTSPVIVVCALNSDQLFKCIPVFIKANHGDWIRKLTRQEQK